MTSNVKKGNKKMAILREIFNILSVEFTVMLTAALPIIELKGAIPVGISLGLSPLHAFFLSFIGSLIPVPFILILIKPIFDNLRKTKVFRALINMLIARSFNKSNFIRKYGPLGLLIFVALPIPGTGVWSGSLIAALLNIRYKRAFPSIIIGNLISGTIVWLLSVGALSIS